MGKITRNIPLERIRNELPRGIPFDLATLKQHGVSAQFASSYATQGWIVRLSKGIYVFPDDHVGVQGALIYLRSNGSEFHVGGASALTLHYSLAEPGNSEPFVLWGKNRLSLPGWFTSLYPSRYVHARIFEWSDERIADRTLTTLPTLREGLRAAAPERAVLEMLYEAGIKLSLESARTTFDQVHSLHEGLLGQLLSCCTSIKAVRLFLTWARETELVDVDALLKQHPVRNGSASRWMSRMADGSLLTLKPYG